MSKPKDGKARAAWQTLRFLLPRIRFFHSSSSLQSRPFSHSRTRMATHLCYQGCVSVTSMSLSCFVAGGHAWLGGVLNMSIPSEKVRKVCWFNEHDSAWPSWHPSQEDKIHPGPNYATICHLLGSIQPLPNLQPRNAQVRWIGASQIHLKSERIWSTCRSNLIGLAQWSDAGGSYIHPFRRSCLVCQTASLPWIETEPPREWQPEKGWYQLQARSLISSINCDANLLDLATIYQVWTLQINPLRVMQVSFPELSFIRWETLEIPYLCHGSFGEQLVRRSLEGFSMKQNCPTCAAQARPPQWVCQAVCSSLWKGGFVDASHLCHWVDQSRYSEVSISSFWSTKSSCIGAAPSPGHTSLGCM